MLLTAFYREDLYANSVLLTIGTISYSLYLVHYCVAVIVWRPESWPEWVAQALLLIGSSVIAAVITASRSRRTCFRWGMERGCAKL